MENVNWLKLKLNQKMMNLQAAKAGLNADLSASNGDIKNLIQNTQNKIINQYQQPFINPQQLRMNNLASIDRAVYVKNLLNLPKNMVELLVMVQNDAKQSKIQNPSLNPDARLHNDISDKIKDNIANRLNNVQENINKNKEIFNTKNNIKNQSLFVPHNQLHNAVRNSIRNGIILNQQTAQDIEAFQQLQANNQVTKGMTPEELAQFKQNLASQLNSNVNLTQVSAFLQKNSKIAMNKMVSMMTIATAQGMTDVKPLQETMNVINASVAANSQNDATQTLKNLMLLYLPWLPLQEGVGFDLEVEQDEEMATSDTFIKILITTVNYGNLHATVSLVSGNSVDVAIICSKKFPKKELFKRLQKDGSQHSMQTVIDFKEQKPQEQFDTINPKAKVNLSNVNQVNPYLLLMSHAIIRHTIEIDATVSIGAQPIED